MQLRHIIFGIRSDPGGDDDVVRDALRPARCVRIQSGEGELRNKRDVGIRSRSFLAIHWNILDVLTVPCRAAGRGAGV